MRNFINTIQDLIKNNDLEKAIDKILRCLSGKNTNLHNEAILHKSNLNQNNDKQRQGLITNDEANRERTRLNHAILSLLVEIENEGIKCEDGPEEKINLEISPSSGIVSDYSPNKLKILFLGANPTKTTRIRIEEEIREIEIGLRMSKERENIVLVQRWAVRPSLLQQAILDENPDIIHFSGHGKSNGLVMEGSTGNYKLVNEKALQKLFLLFSDNIKCVILNSCYSEKQAKAISNHIPFVVGMSKAVPDKAALAFAIGFYRAIGAGKDIEFAFRLGVNSIQLEGIQGYDIPKLLKKS